MRKADVLIITAAQGEDEAVRDVANGALGPWRDCPKPPGYLFPLWQCSFERAGGRRPMRVVLARAPDQREHAAAGIAGILVSHFQPFCLAMCGVCAGRDGEVNLGDVIIADKVWKYDAGALVRNPGATEAEFLPEIETYQLPKHWKLSAESYRCVLPTGADWLAELPDRGASWQIRLGGMATGADLVKDPTVLLRIARTQNRHVLGLEMEAAAIGWLAEALDVRRMMIAKGVMDFSDPAKSNKCRRFAAHAAAEVLIQFLREHLDEPEATPELTDILLSNRSPRPKQNTNPGSLLTARYEVVEFLPDGREEALKDLDAWCAADAAPGLELCLVTGDGGAGKTRLFIEYAARLRARGWEAGFLRPRADAAAISRTLSAPRPILVVIDYAESRPELLDLLRAMTDPRTFSEPVRVVLLAREKAAWWDSLARLDVAVEALLGAAAHKPLAPFTLKGPLRAVVFDHAAKKFAAELGNPAPTTTPDLSASVFERPLYVHMAALAAVEGLHVQSERLLEAVVTHETHFWLTAIDRTGLGVNERDLFIQKASRLVGALTLRAGEANTTDVEAIARRVHGPAQEFFPHFLRSLYPPSGETPFFGVLEPDLLGESLIIRVLTDPSTDPAYLRQVFEDNDVPSIFHGLWTLGRISARDSRGAGWICQTIEPDVEARALPALYAALSLRKETAVAALGAVIARLLNERDAPIELAQLIGRMIPERTVSLGSLAEWANRRQLAGRSVSGLVSEQERARNARSLGNYSNRLRDLGRRDEALGAARDATAVFRALALSKPDEFESELATSLNNLGNVLSDCGDRPGALSAAREAVEICRRLGTSNREKFESDLATALSNLGVRLSETGDWKGALIAAREACDLHRRLSSVNPEAFEPDLASSLNNLGNRLGETGDRPGALAAAREVCELYRRLSRSEPDAFEPYLAASLNNLAGRLYETGELADALAPAREAIELFRRLSRLNPEAFEPSLALISYNWSNWMRKAGDAAGALAAARDACEMYRRLSQSNADAFEPGLAQSLCSLSTGLREADDPVGALTAAREAVVITTRLARREPQAFGHRLLSTLRGFMGGLSRSDRDAEQDETVIDALRVLSECGIQAEL